MDSSDPTLYNKSGNFDLVEVGNADISVHVYGLLTAEGEYLRFRSMGVDEGDTLSIKALYSEAEGIPQIKNAVFVSVAKKTEQDEQAIDNTNADAKAVKMIIHGQIIIRRDDKLFDIFGRQLQ